MKIAIYHNLPGGGSLKVMWQTIEWLLESGAKVDLYFLTESKLNVNRHINTKKCKLYEYKVKPWRGFFLRNLWIYLKLPNIQKKIAKKINSVDYDFVIFHHDYFTKSPYLLNYVSQRKIYFLHEPQREFYESWKIHAPTIKNKLANIFRYPIKLIDQKNTKAADLIIANSTYSQMVIQKVYHRKSKLLYPSVNLSTFSPHEVEKTRTIIAVGSITRVKGFNFVIKSLLPILGKYELLIIGDGPKKEIDHLFKTAGEKKNNLKVVSTLSENKLAQAFRKSLVHCIGAHDEPFGITSIEAQATGTPVVAVREGGVPESVLNGTSGFLTNRDPELFLEATEKAIKNLGKLRAGCLKNSLKFSEKMQEVKFNKIIADFVSKNYDQ